MSHTTDASTAKVRWNKMGIPLKGWTCVDTFDRGANSLEPCTICGTLHRYAHVLRHPDHHDVEVGRDCAGQLTGDYEGASGRERLVRNAVARVKRKMAKPLLWKISKSGNATLHHDDLLFVVSQNANGFACGVTSIGTNRWHTIGIHRTLQDAKDDAERLVRADLQRELNEARRAIP